MSDINKTLWETAVNTVREEYRKFVEEMQEDSPGFGELVLYISDDEVVARATVVYHQLQKQQSAT